MYGRALREPTMCRCPLAPVIVALLGSASSTSASTLTVPAEYPTIQTAIAAAANGDTVFVFPGTYAEALAWSNKNLTLRGDDLGLPVVITGSFTSRVMSVGPGVTEETAIENLTIRDGRAEYGGGIELLGSVLVIHNCRFEANVVAVPPYGWSRGGALFVGPGSSAVVTDCVFRQNQSIGSFPFVGWPGEGGAVYVESGGSLSVQRCRFLENEAWGFEGGLGGGICLSGEPTAFATGIIDSCAFVGNRGNGGGVFAPLESLVTVRSSIFQGNTGWSGSALYADGVCSIEDNQFFENLTTGYEGGAITALGRPGTGLITNNTIAFNDSWNGKAGAWVASATVRNNIICGNRGWGVIQCPENPVDWSCNDVWGNTLDGAPANYYGCDLTGVRGNISSDPLFCAPEDRDFTLHVSSPCLAEPCGQMGALGAGCGINAVDEAWGSPPRVPHLVVFPNPVGHTATFMVNPAANKWAVDVYDAQGRCFAAVQGSGTELTWKPTATAANGVYFARARGVSAEVVKFVLLR